MPALRLGRTGFGRLRSRSLGSTLPESTRSTGVQTLDLAGVEIERARRVGEGEGVQHHAAQVADVFRYA